MRCGLVFCRDSDASGEAEACRDKVFLCHDRAGSFGVATKNFVSRHDLRAVGGWARTTAHDRKRLCEQCVLTLHTTDLRQCPVLCTVWVTVHGHCSRTLFIDTVHKKITKMTPRIRRHSFELSVLSFKLSRESRKLAAQVSSSE